MRIHGNYATPDAAVLALADLTIGQPLPAGGTDAVAERLRRSGKFESVEVRKRYRSLEATDQVVIIIIVQEHPGVEIGGVMPGPMKRLGNASMVLPILDYLDGYGFTAGIVAYIAKLHPYGVVVASIAFGALILAGREIQPSGIPAMIQGIILFSLIASEVVLRYRIRLERRHAFAVPGAAPGEQHGRNPSERGGQAVAAGPARQQGVR